MGQLGWVWFGGRSYKITVFYLTEDNSIFCREDDQEPILLVSELPKRVEIGISGSVTVNHPGQGGQTSEFSMLGFIGTALGGQTFSSFNVERGIGNSLDDPRSIAGDETFNSNQHRNTINITTTLSNNAAEFGATITNSSLGFKIPGGSAISGYRHYKNNPFPFSFNIIKSHGDQSSVVIILSGQDPSSATGTYNIIDISNAFGFMARVLPNKTVFAVTDGISRESFESYRNRITTGTLDSFSTYQLPTIPTLDPDLFTENDEVLSDEKQPYSIVEGYRSTNYYDNDGNFTQTYVNGFSLIVSDLFTVSYKDIFTNSQEVNIQVFDKKIHQDIFTTPVASMPTKTIPGLPANTKAVLGVLACPY